MTDAITLPILTLKNSVLFPFALMPVSIARPQSIAAIEAAVKSEEKLVAVFTQRSPADDDPQLNELYPVGTKAVIRRMGRADETIQALIQGTERIHLDAMDISSGYPKGTLPTLPMPLDTGTEVEALERELIEVANSIQDVLPAEPKINIAQLASQLESPIELVYLLAAMVGLEGEKGNAVLSAGTRVDAMRLLYDELVHERQVAEVRSKIARQATTEINKEQREYLLRQQMRAIQDELGEQSPEKAEVSQLRKRLADVKLPEDVRREADRELSRLESTPAAAPDFQVTRSHLELILELPWNETTPDNFDLASARRVLDEDHYGLADIKERILEHLAVMKLNPQANAPILCFIGPPGVGKTSLGQSIARALGRKFERLSLGGLHDEA